jgi:hypothetical protein
MGQQPLAPLNEKFCASYIICQQTTERDVSVNKRHFSVTIGIELSNFSHESLRVQTIMPFNIICSDTQTTCVHRSWLFPDLDLGHQHVAVTTPCGFACCVLHVFIQPVRHRPHISWLSEVMAVRDTCVCHACLHVLAITSTRTATHVAA